MKEIRTGTRHPHPDKTWTDADVVAQALESWRTTKADVERAVEEGRYADAKALLPPDVQDATGGTEQDLAFWHVFLEHLVGFHGALVVEVPKLDKDARTLVLADGSTAPVLTVTETTVSVGPQTVIPWAQVPPTSVANLAKAAFDGKETRYQVFLMAYAYARRLRDPFYEAQLTIDLSPDKAQFDVATRHYDRTVEERMKPPPPRDAPPR